MVRKKKQPVSKKFIPQASIVSDEIYIPNHSGIADHPEFNANTYWNRSGTTTSLKNSGDTIDVQESTLLTEELIVGTAARNFKFYTKPGEPVFFLQPNAGDVSGWYADSILEIGGDGDDTYYPYMRFEPANNLIGLYPAEDEGEVVIGHPSFRADLRVYGNLYVDGTHDLAISGEAALAQGGTIQDVPVDAKDIVNKEYVDDKDVESFPTSLTAGSAVFSDGSNLTQDNANFFWDDTNNRLGIGTNSPLYTLDINAGGNNVANFKYTGGDAIITIECGTNNANSLFFRDGGTTNFQIYNLKTDWQLYGASSNLLMTVENGGDIGIGNMAPTIKLDVNAKSGHTDIGGFCIMLTNKSGANSVPGDIVIAHTTIDDAVTVAGANDTAAIGVFLNIVRDGEEAWVVVGGIADVHIDSNGASNGDRLITSGGIQPGGRGTVNNTPATAAHFQEIGHCIQTTAANGTGRCVLHFN